MILAILGFIGPVSGISSSIGSTIPLSGYASGTNTVYLFLTGPNLPANGVSLDNVNQRADEGYFTQVDVISGKWSYSWNTQNLGLDSGTYTVWVIDGPADRSHLAGYDYGTISVTFASPVVSISAPTPAPTGSLFIRSDPSLSGVFLAGTYYGTTPLEVRNLTVGTYPLTLARYGYANTTMEAKVVSGERTTLEATLMPLPGEISVNTSFVGATVSVDGVNSGVSPASVGNLISGNHTVATTLDGYQPVETKVALEPGDAVSVNLSSPTVAGTQKSGLSGYPALMLALLGLAISLSVVRKSTL
ncbi:MAG: PEGA domain-containing protein [Methanoregulaceae archaeon]